VLALRIEVARAWPSHQPIVFVSDVPEEMGKPVQVFYNMGAPSRCGSNAAA
jgi:hypothetical protein